MTREQQDEGVPIPPDEFLQAVVGHADRGAFARSRVAGPERMIGYLEQAGLDHGDFQDVLDFGCGVGRIAAGWMIRNQGFRLTGVDINPKFIAWCQENVEGVDFHVSKLLPPLDFADGSFDFAYAISVFTHLDLRHQREWVDELWRLVRPGGAIFITFHGHLYHDVFFGRAKDGRETFERERHLVLSEDHQGTRCASLHEPEFLVEVFRPFEPVLHVEGPCHVAGRQDAYLFRRP